jgi:hypothetical protein
MYHCLLSAKLVFLFDLGYNLGKLFFNKQSCQITPTCQITQNFQPYFLQVRTTVQFSIFVVCKVVQNSLKRYATRLSGGGWAYPKNGVALFWALGWRCGVSAANTAKANFLKNEISICQ